jgi:hypothetical protein
MSQIKVRALDDACFTASAVCDECGLGFASGGDSRFAAESGTRRQLRQHEESVHGVVDVDEGDLELPAG